MIEWKELTEEDTEVGEAGEPDLSGLDEDTVDDELLPFESVCAQILCCSEATVTGAL